MKFTIAPLTLAATVLAARALGPGCVPLDDEPTRGAGSGGEAQGAEESETDTDASDSTATGNATASPSCSPLAQDCAEGMGCYPVEGSGVLTFACVDVDSVELLGQDGDPCELSTACGPGLMCVSGPQLENCSATIGCCTPLCELDGASSQCSGSEQCIALDWSDAVTSLEVGVCAAPG